MRIRTVKPEFFTDSKIAALPPLCRIFFQGLWCEADREGRLEDKPKELKVKILPYDKVDVEQFLDILNKEKMIMRYEVEGRQFIQITNFLKHQRPNNKENQSLVPRLDLEKGFLNLEKDSLNPDLVEGERKGKGRGKERKGMEEEKKTPKVPFEGSVADFKNPTSTSLGKRMPTLEKSRTDEKSESAEIISYLNEKAGTKYFTNGKLATERINARFNDGFKLADFKTAIDKKCAEWLGTDHAKYLRPETLFGRKFEGYMNQLVAIPKGQRPSEAEIIMDKWVKDRKREEDMIETTGEILDD